MTEPTEIWVCTGPRCELAGGGELLRVARKAAAKNRAFRVCTRHCFARCEQRPAPLPSVKVGGDWLYPVDALRLRTRLSALAGQAGGA